MKETKLGWTLVNRKVVTRRDCEKLINESNSRSPETDIEMARRTKNSDFFIRKL